MNDSANGVPLLKIEDLTTRFDIRSGLFGRPSGRVHAVESVTLEIGHGETVAVVGESGCGKSTTGRSILRLDPPTSGRIYFEGVDTTDFGPEEMRPMRRNMQMIFQDPYASLNPRMTAASSIGEPMQVHGLVKSKSEMRGRVLSLLERVGLGKEHMDRYPHEFSGGQRQRLCIARALGLNPKLIIADEAVAALDVTIQAQVINLLMGLQEDFGISFMFISHDMAVVERISHRVAVMYLGQIVELGPRQSVFNNPRHWYTQKLLSAVPIADPAKRKDDRELNSDEIPSAVRPLDFQPELVQFDEVEPGHFVANN